MQSLPDAGIPLGQKHLLQEFPTKFQPLLHAEQIALLSLVQFSAAAATPFAQLQLFGTHTLPFNLQPVLQLVQIVALFATHADSIAALPLGQSHLFSIQVPSACSVQPPLHEEQILAPSDTHASPMAAEP